MPLLITLAEATVSEQIASALTEITTIVTKCLSIITGNMVLMVLFCGGLLGVGYHIISQAKRASRN